MTRVTKFILNSIKRFNKPGTMFVILLIVLVVLGSLYIYYAWNSSMNETSQQALKIASTAGTSLNGGMLKKLRAVPEDIDTTAYQSIKKRLMEIVNINSEIRFAYFYTQKAGKIYFMADSEPADSKDCSPPGQEYFEADKTCFKPFEDGKALITEPTTDRWGTWVSILIPLKDSETGKIIAVFGTDYSTKMWNKSACVHAIQAGIVIFAILLLILAFYKLLNINKVLKEEKNKLNLANDEIVNTVSEIKKSEEKFSKAFQSGAVLMTISRAKDGCFIDVNDTFLKTLDFKRDEAIGKTSTDLGIFVDKRQRTVIKKIFDEEGRVSNLEVLIRGRDGFIHTGILSVNSIEIADTPCWLTTIINITDRKVMENALKESEEKHRNLIENSYNIIYILKANGIFTFVSPAWTVLLGHPVSQVVGQPFQQFVHADDLAGFMLWLQKVIETGQRQRGIEYRVQHADGSWYWHTSSAVPLRDKAGTIIGIEGTARDITERKHAQKALKESEARLRAITESAQDVILMMDQNGIISYWNPAAERVLGYMSTEAIGQNLHLLIAPQQYHPAHQAAFPLFQQTGQGGAVGKILDLEALRKDGTMISVQLSLSAVQMSDDWHSVGIIRDITKQKQAESELIKAKELAEAATRAKSEFLANMSHEIRTPMNAIIGFSRLIKNTVMTPKQQDYVYKIDSSAKSLLDIINDILDFSKIEAGKLEMEAVDFRLDDVISNIAGMISVKAAEKNIELLNNITDEVPNALIGDPLRLGQVLVNLANNAVKFTEKGHILIKAELIEKDALHCRIKFSVNDTGIGMTKEQISKLFSAFSQADSSVTRRFGGTGLGLTISKRLVEMMNGEIFVESEFGVGSTFTFTAEFKRQLKEKENRVIDKEKLRHLKVLIVDDNETARDILKKQLSTFGINAFAVDCGSAAILEIKQESIKKPYNLVFIDWRMPGMDGIETAKIITNDKDVGQQPTIVMVTAFGREEIVKEAEKIGINVFLMKPVNQSLLFDTIMNIFGMDTAESLTQTFDKKDIADLIDGINGTRVLLVEDNVLNQEVATEILRSAGAIVKIANNGKQAVRSVASSYYDIVLMDLQMPIMGGYEAARLIRTDKKYKDLPIIAMTAHAMQGVKEECLKAGMNDYVSKPIEPDNLFSVIKKWIKPTIVDNGRKIKKTNEIADENMTYIKLLKNMSEIDIESGVKRLNGNRKLYRKLLIDFSGSYSSSSEDIRKAIEQSNIDIALRLNHTLKSVAGNISAYNIQNIAVELETAIMQNAKEKIDSLLSELDKALKSFNESLKGLTETKKMEALNNEKPLNLSGVEPVLQELARLVWEDNIDAENFLEELKKCIGVSKFSEEIQALSESISNFDFEAAKDPLRRIANEMNVILGGK